MARASAERWAKCVVGGHQNPRVFGEDRGLSTKTFTAATGRRLGETLFGIVAEV